jgi:hypothetical protein
MSDVLLSSDITSYKEGMLWLHWLSARVFLSDYTNLALYNKPHRITWIRAIMGNASYTDNPGAQ